MANSKVQKLRYEIAAEAARIIASGGLQDFLAAKRKAAARLGISELRFLPRNIEIKEALKDYQSLFHSKSQPTQLRALREAALKAMDLFVIFQPRLVGDVLDGIANQYSKITLHLFSDTAEEVVLFLHQKHIHYQASDSRLRVNRDQFHAYPTFCYFADKHSIALVVFPVDGLRQAPRSPIDGKPLRRASQAAVLEILAQPA